MGQQMLLYLKVVTLSDITTSDAKLLQKDVLDGR